MARSACRTISSTDSVSTSMPRSASPISEGRKPSAVSAAVADFVTGVRDLDKDWDAYVKSLHDMGLDTYMEAMQSCWTRMTGE